MYLGFTNKKITAIILLLACIFISLALSHIPFLVSDHKASIYMEGLTEGAEGADGEDVEAEETEAPAAPVAPVAPVAPTQPPKPKCVAPQLGKKPKDFNNQLRAFADCVNNR